MEKIEPPRSASVTIEPAKDIPVAQAVASPETPSFPSSAVPPAGIRVDFDGIEIKDFVRVVADSLGLNYAIDPAVTGTVTVHTGQTLTGVQLYAVFRQILQANGLEIRHDGPVPVIQPAKGGRKRYDLAGLHVRFLPVAHASVSLIGIQIQQALTAFDEKQETVKIVPLEQLSALMLLAGDSETAETVSGWVRDLDVTPSDARQGVYMYNVRCGLASDLCRLVNSLLYLKETEQKPEAAPAPAEKPLSLPTTLAAATLIPDDSRNVILIRSSVAEHGRIVKILEQLDVVPRQVLIDVLVAEVTLADALDFGVEWAIKNNQLKIGGSSYQQKGAVSFANVVPSAVTGGFAYTILNSVSDPVAVVNALASTTDVSLISSPQIFVENNREAYVNVGDRVPVVVSETDRTGDLPTVDRQVQYYDTGTILRVTPRINFDGMVSMDVSQQVSQAVSNQTSGINSPVISTREVKTRLTVRDGQPIMLGGLISRGDSQTENRVPLFGDLPVIGSLFRYNGSAGKRTELLVMITPHVVYADGLDAYQATYRQTAQDLKNRLAVKTL